MNKYFYNVVCCWIFVSICLVITFAKVDKQNKVINKLDKQISELHIDLGEKEFIIDNQQWYIDKLLKEE